MSAHEWGTENKSLSGNFQHAWDSTSLGLFKTCPRKYQLTMLKGWTKKKTPLPLWFGIEFHHAVEFAEHARACGEDEDTVQEGTLLEILKRNGHREWEDDNGNWQKREAFADLSDEDLNELRESRWVPFESDDSKRNLWTLVRAVLWYLDKFSDDPAETFILANGKAAVELSFSFELPLECPATGEPYLLCGHLDRLVKFHNQAWGMDHKTSANGLGDFFWANFTPNNQMSLYTIAGKVVYHEEIKGMMVNGVELAVGHNRFQRGFAKRTQAQNDEWLNDTLFWIKQAETCAELEHWPMNDESCGKYGGCPFRGVCARSPEVREQFLRADFERQVWDPMRAR